MKAVTLISGGIDSPVAAYLMARAGADVVLLHMDNRPFADDMSIERVKQLAAQISKAAGKEIPLYSAAHGPTQDTIMHNADHAYQCVLCKHAMQATAREFCKRIGADAIVMGDSLGQVASQTLSNIAAEFVDIGFTILRPLIGLDKLEIENIAKEIGTYEISILPAVGCTALPQKVITMAKPEKTLAFSEKCGIEDIAVKAAAEAVRLC